MYLVSMNCQSRDSPPSIDKKKSFPTTPLQSIPHPILLLLILPFQWQTILFFLFFFLILQNSLSFLPDTFSFLSEENVPLRAISRLVDLCVIGFLHRLTSPLSTSTIAIAIAPRKAIVSLQWVYSNLAPAAILWHPARHAISTLHLSMIKLPKTRPLSQTPALIRLTMPVPRVPCELSPLLMEMGV